MEYRRLGNSGLQVSVLAFGTTTFGGGNEFFRTRGSIQVPEATRLIDVALDAGVNLFDTADSYSDGLAEEILGKAIGKRRNDVLIATKAAYRTEPGPNGLGTSRHHLLRTCEASLRRLGTDYIDLYQVHAFDALTPVEETLRALEDLVREGKVRYVGCSNFSGWHLMKSLAASEKYGLPRYSSHQAYYSLVGREYEWELLPLAMDQNVATLVWSPLAGGRLSGKVRRNQPLPEITRLRSGDPVGPVVDQEYLYRTVDALDQIAAETGRSVSQISLNWLLRRPTVSSLIFGARNEQQLKENLGAEGWSLADGQVRKLDEVTATRPVYPYWQQRATFAERNPFM